MAATSKSRSNGPVLPLTLSFRSLSPSTTFSSPPPPLQPPPSFSSEPSDHFSSSVFDRPSSPTRVNLSPSSPTAFRLSINNRFHSPNSRATVTHTSKVPAKFAPSKKACLCSPTSHPGSFKCAFHRNNNNSSTSSVSCSPIRLNLRRSAMTNSLVRIGTVEGDWVRRALTALIRPSSHQQRRRFDFEPRRSRLSVMSKG